MGGWGGDGVVSCKRTISITIFSNDLTEYIVVYCVVNLESNCPSFSFTALVSLKMGVVVCLLEHCCC